MSDDVTITRETAKRVARTLRMVVQFGDRQASDADLRRWADLLDSPTPSLRDEVANAIAVNLPKDGTGLYAADVALAVVWKRIGGMRGWDGGVASMDWSPDGPWIDRGDVLRLLLGGDQ